MSSDHAAAPTPTTLPTDDDVLQGGVQRSKNLFARLTDL
jgi:hypothetical protein